MSEEERNTRGHRGDDGRSDLIGGERPAKSDPVFACLGWLDELTSCVGLLRAELREAAYEGPVSDENLRAVQVKVSELMGLVAGHRDDGPAPMGDADLEELEAWEKQLRARTPLQPKFSVPGDSGVPSALADVARARCRTAERALAAIAPGRSGEDPLGDARRYINRLSDYLFIVARHLDQAAPPPGRA